MYTYLMIAMMFFIAQLTEADDIKPSDFGIVVLQALLWPITLLASIVKRWRWK